MMDTEKLSHAALLAALHCVPSTKNQHYLISLYSMEVKQYPHIAMLYKEQVKNALRVEPAKDIKSEMPIFTGTFSCTSRPEWLRLNFKILDTSLLVEKKRKLSGPKTPEAGPRKYRPEFAKGPSTGSSITIPQSGCTQGSLENYGFRANMRNSDEDRKKDAGFMRATKLLPKGHQQPPQNEEENRVQTENGKNGKRKFVPPFANPEKRAEYGTTSKDPPTTMPKPKRDEEKSGKNESDRLIEQIENEILDNSPCIQWEDIIGLDYAKKTIEEILILPITLPELREIINFPRGILLFGPPGTGKTMIAKAVATQCQSTFFNISASILTSKWMGEGEKLVRALFEVARQRQPSIIFIDEIDSLLCARSEGDFESSRRLKTEFLVRMEGVSNGSVHDDQVIIIGATNRPQELDEAVRRRLAKRLYIPLPNKAGRNDFLSKALAKCKLGHSLTSEQVEKLAVSTKGYSGADLKALITEAAMYPVRSILGRKNVSISEIRKISYEDFVAALEVVKATVSKEDLGKYLEWNKTFGSYPFSEAELDN